MAGVTARKRGTYWEYRFEIASSGGKRKQCSKSGFRTKSEAVKAGTESLARYNRSGILFIPSEASVSDWIEHWLYGRGKAELSIQAFTVYEQAYRIRIKPLLGKYRIGSITPLVVADFVASLAGKGYSTNTIRNALSCLSDAMKDAILNGIILFNPCRDMKMPRSAKKPKATHPANEEDLAGFLSTLDEDDRLPFQIAWHTGMRISEACALRWRDVDFDSGTIHVVVAAKYIRNVYRLEAPKDHSERHIHMDPELASLLLAAQKRQGDRKRLWGRRLFVSVLMADGSVMRTHPGDRKTLIDFVCQRSNGQWLRPNRIQLWMYEYNKKNKTDLHFHQLRHSHATMLIQHGVDPVVVQHRLGHKNLSTTMTTYTHLSVDVEQNVASKIDSIVERSMPCGQNVDKTVKKKKA